MPNRSSHARTTASGPPSAIAATTVPKIGMKTTAVNGPNTSPRRVSAAIPMTNSSNAAQPRSWNTFNAVGRYEPRRPRMGRRLTIVGTPARLPWRAAAASIPLPTADPTTATSTDSPSVKPKPKPPTPMRSVPAARTSNPMPRLDHNTKKSNAPMTRRESGTGSTPHSGGLRKRSIGSPRLTAIYRIWKRAEGAGLESLRHLREFLVRMLQRGDKRKLLPREEIDERSAARADVVDPILQAELFDGRDRMTAAHDREGVRFGDGGEQLPRSDREWFEFEDARGSVEENRLRAANLFDISRDCVQSDIVDWELSGEGRDGSCRSLAPIVQDDIRGQEDPSREFLEEILAHRPLGIVLVDLPAHEVRRRRARVEPRGVEEEVRHAAGREDGIDEILLEHVTRDRDGVVRFHAPKEGNLRPRRVLHGSAEHRQLALHDSTGERREDLAESDKARLGPVCGRARVEDGIVRVGRQPPHGWRLRHFLWLCIGERLFLRIETRVLQDDHVAGSHRLDRFDRGSTEQARHVPHGSSQESADALRVDFERREVILPRSGLMREEGHFRMSQLADRRQVLSDSRVVQEGAGPGIDWGVDVDPEQDRPAREVEIVHREEVSGHRRRRYIPGRNSFFASGRTLATARNQSVFSNGETRLEPF